MKYTQNILLDTFDFIKKSISLFDIIFQLFYITYVSCRLVFQIGNDVLNIVLLFIAMCYLIYHLSTIREFYTKKEIKRRKATRYTVKIIKYAIRLYIIIVAVLELYKNLSANDNMTILLTTLMILGLMFSVLFDFVLIIINSRIALIKPSISYDIKLIRGKYTKTTWAAKQVGIDLEELFPPISNKKTIEKITDINQKQENKAMRRRDFKKLKNK